MALTRARRGLVVLGHRATLRHDGTWADFLNFVDAHGLEGAVPRVEAEDEEGEVEVLLGAEPHEPARGRGRRRAHAAAPERVRVDTGAVTSV